MTTANDDMIRTALLSTARTARKDSAKTKAPAKAAQAPAKAKAAPKAPKTPAKANVAATAAATPAKGRAGTKRAIVAELLQREDGATLREILTATGWPAVSVPAVAKASGLTLRKEKGEDGVTVYHGTPSR